MNDYESSQATLTFSQNFKIHRDLFCHVMCLMINMKMKLKKYDKNKGKASK